MDQIKKKAKEVVLQRLINTTSRPENQTQPPQIQGLRVDTEQDFRKMPYEGKAKYDNELKALNALKSETEERSQRPKKMFFEHYDTEESYEPRIQNNSNPSGRPPGIPASMYEGIVVKPKRPWVYLGTQNLPPVEYQEINQSSFKNITKKNLEPNQKDRPKNPRPPSNQAKVNRPHKKEGSQKKEPGQQSEFSEFDMSDEIVDEGESIFASESFNKQSQNRKSRMSSGKISEHSYFGQDYSAEEGTETKNKQAEMFGSDMEDESQMFSRGKRKDKKSKKEMKMKKREERFSDEDNFD